MCSFYTLLTVQVGPHCGKKLLKFRLTKIVDGSQTTLMSAALIHDTFVFRMPSQQNQITVAMWHSMRSYCSTVLRQHLLIYLRQLQGPFMSPPSSQHTYHRQIPLQIRLWCQVCCLHKGQHRCPPQNQLQSRRRFRRLCQLIRSFHRLHPHNCPVWFLRRNPHRCPLPMIR